MIPIQPLHGGLGGLWSAWLGQIGFWASEVLANTGLDFRSPESHRTQRKRPRPRAPLEQKPVCTLDAIHACTLDLAPKLLSNLSAVHEGCPNAALDVPAHRGRQHIRNTADFQGYDAGLQQPPKVRRVAHRRTNRRRPTSPYWLSTWREGVRHTESYILTLQLEPACNNRHVAMAGAGVEDGRANEGCSPSLPYTKHLHEETVTL